MFKIRMVWLDKNLCGENKVLLTITVCASVIWLIFVKKVPRREMSAGEQNIILTKLETRL